MHSSEYGFSGAVRTLIEQLEIRLHILREDGHWTHGAESIKTTLDGPVQASNWEPFRRVETEFKSNLLL